MAQTIVGVNSPRAVRRWGGGLTVDTDFKSYFKKRFIGTSDNSMIQLRKELETDAGDVVQFDLNVQLRETPTVGDDRLEGKAENLRFFTDEIRIDQMRKAVSAGGKMTRKRILHDLRSTCRNRLSDYWARYCDELRFIYLSGSRGINPDYAQPIGWTGHAGNPIQAPDAEHILYGGSATSKGTLTTADQMTKTVVERVKLKATLMRAMNPDAANMVPLSVEGEDRYILLMHPAHAYSLRVTDTAGWIAAQQAAAGSEGRNNPIFKGGLGLMANTVLHEHERVIRFSDYGVGANVAAARALYLGRQAGVEAYGMAGGLSFQWNEESQDHGNLLEIASGTIWGFKKARFDNRDFGVIAVDAAIPLSVIQ